ncbi:flagellar hook-length control protein FliK [uncultured Sphingomonas sp.]|uniref:flagellar hook-length control protein FliK n=1 Tax=uncultured Sphingomonas sp. TaxID=158754 RepID=UPI0035CB05EC
MPTITSTTTMSLVPGAPGKVPASLLTLGEPALDFQALLGATVNVAPPMVGEAAPLDQLVRQPVAASGTGLPVEPAMLPPSDTAAPIDVMPAIIMAEGAPPLMATPPVEEPAPPTPDKIVPSLAAVPMLGTRQQPVVATKILPPKEKTEQSSDSEEPETPVDLSASLPTAPLAATISPIQTAVLAPKVKTSPLPLISVARQGPPARPVIAAAIQQTLRDTRWDGAAPVVTPLASAPALPVPEMPGGEVALPLPTTPTISTPLTAPPRLPSIDTPPVAVVQSPAPVVAPPTAAAPTPPPAIVVGPALQVFGAAISAAARHERGEEAVDPFASLGSVAPLAAPVAPPVATAAQPTLDMRQERWPQAMIAHIETLRDNADAGDTRIRLIPDALGMIDVAVKRDHDTLHVQFTAEQATTRTLIQDAQPRLAALAEERGLRLGQTVVDAGAAGSASQQPQQSQQQRQPQRDAALPTAPRRSTPSNDDQDRADDGRLA